MRRQEKQTGTGINLMNNFDLHACEVGKGLHGKTLNIEYRG
jgi:hypothetical protein